METTTNTYFLLGQSTESIQYIYDQNMIIGMVYTKDGVKETYYLRRNVLGDVTAIFGYNGTKVAEYVYDAWGNCTILNSINSTIGNINPIRYRGYYYDVETQLYWVSSRYYSPELCRWISPDDIEYLDPDQLMDFILLLQK